MSDSGWVAEAQSTATKKVSGTVIDDTGEPVIGATVRLLDGSKGTVTNIDGAYQLYVPVGSTLSFSFIGLETKELVWDGVVPFNVTLSTNTKVLNEVVVVGYGVQKKVNLSGSVDQVNSKQLENKPITNIAQGLQGMIPNLNIDFTSGEPGKAARINVRGMTSINGGEPLILIDGVSASAGELGRLLPEDIESISVLKDAASAAIYRARASFGVILVTTKQGKKEGIQVDYNNSFTWKKPSILPEKFADPYIYLKTKNIAVLNTPWSGGHVASDERLEWARQVSDNPDGTPHIRLNPLDNTQWEYMGNRNWTDYFLNKFTFSQSHQVSISGKSEKATYYISGGIDREDGLLAKIVNKDYYERLNLRVKGSYDITNWLRVTNNTNYSHSVRMKPSSFWDSNILVSDKKI